MQKTLTVAALIESLQSCRNKESYVFVYDGEQDERSSIVAVDDNFYQEENGSITDVDLNIVRPTHQYTVKKPDPITFLRKAFECFPGDIINKNRISLENQDWHNQLTETLKVVDITIEEDNIFYYKLQDGKGRCLVLTGTDFV